MKQLSFPLALACALSLAPAARAAPDGGSADAAPAARAITAAEPAPGQCAGHTLIAADVRGSIAATLGRAVAFAGDEIAAHFARIYMWDLDLRHDVKVGDRVELLWRRSPEGELEIGAARYQSAHLGRTLYAFRHQVKGDLYPSYWDEKGKEVSRHLRVGPLAGKEPITSLLKDRPTHQGMDWKAPVGSAVVAPRAGVVTRLNWKLRGNGNCVELRYADGTLAKFLHLSAIKVKTGAQVRAGQVIALSGNTGRSTAPHLHYQLNRGPRVVDPVRYHGVEQRQLSGSDLQAFLTGIAPLARACGFSAR